RAAGVEGASPPAGGGAKAPSLMPRSRWAQDLRHGSLYRIESNDAGPHGAALRRCRVRGFPSRPGTLAGLAALVLAFAVPARATTSPCANVPIVDPQALPCEVAVHDPVPARPGDDLRVVTFNVHFGANVPALAGAIRSNPELSRADVLLLQEIERHPG